MTIKTFGSKVKVKAETQEKKVKHANIKAKHDKIREKAKAESDAS
jgi:uncharacterized membrane protein YqiK